MKVSSAKLSFYRQSPRKVRELANVIRGMRVVDAEAQLTHTPRRAGTVLLKLMQSAAANALDANKALNRNDLVVEAITVDEGPTLKRYRPRAMGRASRINKRTSHISIVLGVPRGTIKQETAKPAKKTTAKKSADKKSEKTETKTVKKTTAKKTLRQAQGKQSAKKDSK